MKLKVTSTFRAQKTANALGMGRDNRLRKYLAARARLRMDPYVPMQAGILKDTAQIVQDGAKIVYNQPYAHYQYRGEVMAGRAPKHYTGKKLRHHGAPMRGPYWDKRMMADHAGDVEKDIAAYLEGKAHDAD